MDFLLISGFAIDWDPNTGFKMVLDRLAVIDAGDHVQVDAGKQDWIKGKQPAGKFIESELGSG